MTQTVLCSPHSAWSLLLSPEVTVARLAEALPEQLSCLGSDNSRALAFRLDVEGHYSDMVSKQKEAVMDISRSDALQLPPDIPYHK